ncbi:Toll-like receptor 1 [Mactra antiquata]
MECSDQDYQLHTICKYINDTTYFDIIALRVSSLIKSLFPEDFLGCQNLMELYLDGNEIFSVQNDTFYDLKHLLVLDLTYNYIDVYDDKTIYFPPTLKYLSLIGNYQRDSHFSNLCYPDLSNLVNLQVLLIDGIPLKAFPTGYRSLVELTNITMSGFWGFCNISAITYDTFINVPYVQNLDISACLIKKVDAFGFGHLAHLEKLDLSYNMQLGFSPLSNITFGLQYTNISILNISKLHSIVGLTTVILVKDIYFLQNTSLKEIDISRNRLGSFDKNVLFFLPKSLVSLRLEYNKLAYQPYVLQFGCLVNLTEIYVSHQYPSFSPFYGDTEGFGFDDSTTDTDTDDICPPNLTDQKEETNQDCPCFKPNETITSAKHRPHYPPKLKNISMAGCSLTAEAVLAYRSFNTELEYIDASSNTLEKLTGTFKSEINLKYLDLSKNYCSHIDKDFFQFANLSLEILQLHNNYLGLALLDKSHGPYIFNNLSMLKSLNLSFNVISYLPKNSFFQCQNLTTLDLSFNNIQQLTFDVSSLTNLLHLIIRNNFIDTLPDELLERLHLNSKNKGTQFTIDMRNNRIVVDCERSTFLHWIVNHKDNMIGFDEYNFVSEDGVGLTPQEFMKAVFYLDKMCYSYTLIIVICVICITAFLTLVCGAIIYNNRWKIRYVLRNAKIKHFKYQSIYRGNECQYTHDVFLSYANDNSEFIRNQLYPFLKEKGLRVCMHEKDFIPGNNIADNILDAISNSRITLAVLSNDYVSSKWCMYEFNMARMESIYDRYGTSCLCLLLYENVPTNKISDEMLHWLHTNTYLEYKRDEQGDISFWESLEMALGID